MTQALLMGSVASVITAMLLLLVFLDNPFRSGRRCAPTGRDGANAAHHRRGDRDAEAGIDDRRLPVRRRWAAAVSSGDVEAGTDRLEIVATVLLALATVATAWSGYQASRWNGEQAKAFSRAQRRTDRVDARVVARRRADADRRRHVHPVGRRVRPRRDDACRLLLQALPRRVQARGRRLDRDKPLKSPNAPLTPFAMPQYKLEAQAEADRLEADAEAWSAQARSNVQRATNYVLAVVLFAATLFFAGMSTKLRSPRLRVVAARLRSHAVHRDCDLDRHLPDQRLRLSRGR